MLPSSDLFTVDCFPLKILSFEIVSSNRIAEESNHSNTMKYISDTNTGN
jgi:hypothetical protein